MKTLYLTIEQLKKYLYIDFEEDDITLGDMIGAAQQTVSNYLGVPLYTLEDEYGMIPTPLLQAIKILSANMYVNRESVAFGQPHKIPYSLEYLIQPYKNYKRENNQTNCQCDAERTISKEQN